VSKIQFTDVKVGQRLHVYYGPGKDNFTGTVNHMVPGLFISVVRDDHKLGTGFDRAWRVNWSSGIHRSFYIELIKETEQGEAKISTLTIAKKLAKDPEEIAKRLVHLAGLNLDGIINVITAKGDKYALRMGDVLFRFRTPPVAPMKDKSAVEYILGENNWAEELFRFLMKEYVYTRIFTLGQDNASRRMSSGDPKQTWYITDTLGDAHPLDDVFNGTVILFTELDFQRFFDIQGNFKAGEVRRIKIKGGAV
jgi:hypothetical protein